MILVLLGTQDKSFHRLLEQVERSIQKGTIQEEVVVHAGYTKYKSSRMKIFDFVDPEELNRYLDEASYVITHAGVGSILGCLKKGKKMIAAPRLKKYKEHTNDHQLQVLKEFDRLGYLLPLYDFTKLDRLVARIPKFQPKKYVGSHQMIDLIADYVDQNIKDVEK